jgi:glycosyltransferase involved in cell wall biosynthesis
MKRNPLLSIITVSAYDHERLSQTIKSLTNSPPEIEHVIVIPKDDVISLEIIQTSSLESSTSFRVFHDSKSGVYPAMNIGGHNALGKFICFWNAGDRLHSQVNLQFLISNLSFNDSSWLIVKGVFDWRDPQKLQLSSLQDFILHRDGAFISHQTVIVNRKVFLKLNGFNTKFKVAADSSHINQLFKDSSPSFLNLDLVDVQAPNFAAKHNRRGRLESLLIVLFELNGEDRLTALMNILKVESSVLLARFSNRKIG